MSEATAVSYQDGVYQAWLGELQGEMFFEHMAQASADEQREKWQTLAELERVTGRRMAVLLTAQAVDLTKPEPPQQLLDALAAYTKMPFAEAVSAMRPILLAAIEKFEALLVQAPAADREEMQFLLDHERALLSFVELEEAEEAEQKAASLDAVRALIQSCASDG